MWLRFYPKANTHTHTLSHLKEKYVQGDALGITNSPFKTETWTTTQAMQRERETVITQKIHKYRVFHGARYFTRPIFTPLTIFHCFHSWLRYDYTMFNCC